MARVWITGGPKVAVVVAAVVAVVAGLVAPAGCSRDDEPGCAEVVASYAFTDGRLCDVTPAGYFLRERGGLLEVGHVSAREVVSLAEVSGFGCGSLAHDPETGRLWVAGPDVDSDAAYRLTALDEDGDVRSEAVLELDGMPMKARTMLVHEGQLYIGGTLVDESVTDGDPNRAFLQRRDLAGAGAGAVAWTRLDYAEARPEGVDVDSPFNSLSDLVGHAGGLSFLARRWGTDSSYVALVTVDTEGAFVWSTVATPDDFQGPYPELASDGTSIYVSEERQAVRDSDWVTLIERAREIVTAYSSSGEERWAANVSWTELREVDVTNAARASGELFNVISGADADGQRQVWLATFADGELQCSSWVDEPGLYSAHTLRGLNTGELAMLAVAGPPDEYGNAPDDPEARLIVLAVP